MIISVLPSVRFLPLCSSIVSFTGCIPLCTTEESVPNMYFNIPLQTSRTTRQGLCALFVVLCLLGLLKGMWQYVRAENRNCYGKLKLDCILALGPIV